MANIGKRHKIRHIQKPADPSPRVEPLPVPTEKPTPAPLPIPPREPVPA